MFKVCYLLVALAIAGASAQEAAEQNAAPEPYAYAYQTDTHQASEQRSPDGRVTGSYSVVDPTDGRERRVEYYADQTGFHAKVATNELGTKSENSADVEVSASPPSEAQLVNQVQTQSVVKQQVVQYPQQQRYSSSYVSQAPASQTTFVGLQQVPAYQQQQRVTSYYQQQQPASAVYGYYQQQPASSAYGYNYGYYPGYGYQTTTNQNAYGVYGLAGGNYNYHLPAQYYSNAQGGGSRYTSYSSSVQPATYTVDGGQNYAGRYVTTTSGKRSYPVSGGSGSSYYYSSGTPGAVTTTRTVTTGQASNNLGSGNLLLLKKK